jgi:hypothetical protein
LLVDHRHSLFAALVQFAGSPHDLGVEADGSQDVVEVVGDARCPFGQDKTRIWTGAFCRAPALC